MKITSQASFSGSLKHVIFLGAGASASSGYPVGQQLRLRIASKEHFRKQVDQELPLLNEVNPLAYNAHAKCLGRFDEFEKSVELFRHGGFASVDEFSKLASQVYKDHLQNMKKLMRIALSLHNPENKFHESDYYSFIQRLFLNKQLNELNPNITVITFNYDCYLDFLLLEAYNCRHKILGVPTPMDDIFNFKLTSGFFDPNASLDLSSQAKGFNYFKLHGSIAYGNDPHFGHSPSFRLDNAKRIEYLGESSLQSENPPVVFPWELFDKGDFVSEEAFRPFNEAQDDITREKARRLFQQLKSIWENAREAVLGADKISFIGLSMHEYLETGFKFLFDSFGKSTDPKIRAWVANGAIDESKPKEVQVVVANIENEHFKNVRNRLHPASPCGKVAELLTKVAPNLKYVRSLCEDDGMFSGSPDDVYEPDITPRYSFKDFIQHEME